MIPRSAAALSLLALLAAPACAAPEAERTAAISDECLIVAEVAKAHYKADKLKPMPLRERGSYTPDCPWAALGLQFAPYERGSPRWISFGPPKIDGSTARIVSGIMHGRLAGRGTDCTLRKEKGAWRIASCRRIWVS